MSPPLRMRQIADVATVRVVTLVRIEIPRDSKCQVRGQRPQKRQFHIVSDVSCISILHASKLPCPLRHAWRYLTREVRRCDRQLSRLSCKPWNVLPFSQKVSTDACVGRSERLVMPDRDPNIIYSGLCRTIDADGIIVDVKIFRLEHDPQWALEVINEQGTSTVWDCLFDTDDEARSIPVNGSGRGHEHLSRQRQCDPVS